MRNAAPATLVALVVLGTIGYASPVGATCAVTYPHPAKARKLQASLVQMFVSCNNPGGNTPNATVGAFPPSCFPAQTFNQQNGLPPEGWTWGPHGTGSISLEVSTDPDAPDLSIDIELKDIRNSAGDPADASWGVGGVLLFLRVTTIDHVTSKVETVIDLPVPGLTLSPFEGAVSKKRSLNALLAQYSMPPLPECSNVEILEVWVMDPDGSRFAELGTFLP